MEGFRGVGMSNHGSIAETNGMAETNAWDRREMENIEAKNHAILLCCQAVMAPAGPVGEASKMSPFCGRPGGGK